MKIPLLSIEVPERRVKTLADIRDGGRALCKLEETGCIYVRERRGPFAYATDGAKQCNCDSYTLCDIDGNPIYHEPEASECSTWRHPAGGFVVQTVDGQYVHFDTTGEAYISTRRCLGGTPMPGKLVVESARAE